MTTMNFFAGSALAGLVMVHASAMADVRTVPSTAYPSISAAVAAAEAGDEIVLLDGELTGPENWDVLIDVPLTIRGASGDPDLVTVRGPNDIARALRIRSPGVRVESVTFTEFVRLGGGAVFVDGGEVDVEDVRFVGNAASSVDFPEPALGGRSTSKAGLHDSSAASSRTTLPRRSHSSARARQPAARSRCAAGRRSFASARSKATGPGAWMLARAARSMRRQTRASASRTPRSRTIWSRGPIRSAEGGSASAADLRWR